MEHPITPSPRLVVAGLSGDSGKTLVSLGLLIAARQCEIPVRTFKKGPDYIDSAWLSWASNTTTRNLDTFLMGPHRTVQHFLSNSLPEGLNLIEGNRGLLDGVDARGTHSTAELAKLLKSPVLLVVNAAKVTHTIAALVLGCMRLDPEVRIGGVILNRVSGRRHESILRESIESACGIPVLGVLPNLDAGALPPNRHLGLVTPQEHANIHLLVEKLYAATRGRLDTGRILELAESAPPLLERVEVDEAGQIDGGQELKIAYLKDSAFSFYYPENLESLESSGTELIPVSALTASALPEDLDALYIGGGFPETHAEALAQNRPLLASIRNHALRGLPIYAECGGLMLLSQAIRWRGLRSPMAGVLPIEVEVCSKPQGHGYVELLVDSVNPYYPVGTRIRGHEFHYSKILTLSSLPPTACSIKRGTGCSGGRDGILVGNAWASYTHVHAVATHEWARGLLSSARLYQSQRSSLHHSAHLVGSGPGTVISVH